MYRFYRWVLYTFGFSKSQTNGILVLLLLICVLLFSESIKRHWFTGVPDYTKNDLEKLDSLIAFWPSKETKNREFESKVSEQTETGKVDPNTASQEELVRAGFSLQIASRIIAYRQKEGIFRNKQDVLKIYGMDSVVFKKVFPYLAVPNRPTVEKNGPLGAAQPVKKTLLQPFDLNKADTVALKSIYGIGDKLSVRIIKYRESLGGFVSLNQLFEIYRLDSGVVSELKKVTFINDHFIPKKMNLNKAEKSLLAAHPYFTRQAADAIVTYRFQHGDFNSMEELRKVKLIDSLLFKKLEPYLTIE